MKRDAEEKRLKEEKIKREKYEKDRLVEIKKREGSRKKKIDKAKRYAFSFFHKLGFVKTKEEKHAVIVRRKLDSIEGSILVK